MTKHCKNIGLMLKRWGYLLTAVVCALAAMVLTIATHYSLRKFPDGLSVAYQDILKPQVLARDGSVLNVSFANGWNTQDALPLQDIPVLLQTAFIASEDRRFYAHQGVDWSARWAAVIQNIRVGHEVRGASTITEQVVRLLHPRPRTLWSRWLEGFEAQNLETRFSKARILAFYLNQVPYTDRRRGVQQAARFYFDRALNTLTPAEMLSLVVLVRSPQGMDLRHDSRRADRAVQRLASRLLANNILTLQQRDDIATAPLTLSAAHAPLEANYFVAHVLQQSGKKTDSRKRATIATTLDPYFQRSAQDILDAALKNLAHRHVRNGALLVIDHARNEVLAWVVSSNAVSTETPREKASAALGYDTVLIPRQPGSSIKPFLYAMALEKGWTAATLIDDSELSESVGNGEHTYHNYSRRHYGPIRLREALGNSLNIPAVKTLQFVGNDNLLNRLHALGVTSLQQHPDFYGDGLALGNGELTLFELAQAYAVLVRHGKLLPLTFLKDDASRTETAVFTPEVTSLIANILADPEARRREFGDGLQFPIETAIKTGTSSDYRDAWAVAFDYSHTVAVWMGNLDGTPMNGVTGGLGPAMVVRSVFSVLNRDQEKTQADTASDTHGLWLSNHLVSQTICRDTGTLADDQCPTMSEWFLPQTLPSTGNKSHVTSQYRLTQPTPGLLVAHDPRIPADLEALTMSVARVANISEVEWDVDGVTAARTDGVKFSWPLIRGTHEVYARIWTANAPQPKLTETVRFYVR